MKNFTGDKYAYYLMAFKLAKANNGFVRIGKDTGYTDGYLFERRFKIQEYKGKKLLIEYKSSKSFADFSRVVEVSEFGVDRTSIRPYVNEAGEDGYKCWVH